MNIIKKIGIGVYIVVAAFFGLSFGFADLGPGESAITRIVMTLGYFLIAGGLFGLMAPERKKFGWIIGAAPIFTLIMTLFGGIIYQSTQELTLGVVGNLLSLAAVIIGTFIGAKLRKSK